MYGSSNRRGLHRKRLSALRLSSDSTATTLPVYTSPPRTQQPALPEIPSEQPPAYPDSAEEADEDTDTSDDESAVAYFPSPPPSLPVSPRRPRRSPASSRSSHRRQQSLASASDPYLDSLLARSVHALEMSNQLLQSSMSTQSSLSAVLADDSAADRQLEERAQKLTSRIRSNRNTHESWMDELEEISRGVEGLVRGEASSDDEDRPRADLAISQSLPTSGLSERMQRQRKEPRRGSQDFRRHHASGSSSNLQLSVHDRSHFIAPAPRAITMYVDSTESADLIALPSTLGVRSSSRPPPSPLPCQTVAVPATPEPDATPSSAPSGAAERSRVAGMLASYVMPRSSSSTSPSTSSLRRRSSSSSASTVKRARISKSPPPPLRLDGSTSSSPNTVRSRSRSTTPIHSSPAPRQARPLTPLDELSTSSTSSESATLHVDRTVESLRQILEKQRSTTHVGRSASSQSAPPVPRPSLLSPPTVAPVSGTSNATASISRLFTKSRHTTSTRAASPPKQSSMKVRSAAPSEPSTPSMPSPSPSLLSVPDLFGLGARTRTLSGGSSGRSTPKRISFAEPIEQYSSTKPEGASSKFRQKSRSRSRSARDRGRAAKGKGKGRASGHGEDDGETGGWWTTWLLGSAAAESGMGNGRSRSEERYSFTSARGMAGGGTWAMRPGFSGTMDEWGA